MSRLPAKPAMNAEENQVQDLLPPSQQAVASFPVPSIDQSSNNQVNGDSVELSLAEEMSQVSTIDDLTRFESDVNKYTILKLIGRGTYGKVYSARDKTTQQIVAIKRDDLKEYRGKFPRNTIREIGILKAFRHENIVGLIEICCEVKTMTHNRLPNICTVLEYCHHDLCGLLNNHDFRFTAANVKDLALQLLRGVDFMHANRVLHRDLKSNNILITKTGVLKIADFGLSHRFSNNDDQQEALSPRVTTFCYRSPEMLLGDQHYDTPSDMWAVGLLLWEIWNRVPLMSGDNVQDQLDLIIAHTGTITEKSWPKGIALAEKSSLSLKENNQPLLPGKLHELIKCSFGEDLVKSMLICNPAVRISAKDALNHPYFLNNPSPLSIGPQLALDKFSDSMTTLKVHQMLVEASRNV